MNRARRRALAAAVVVFTAAAVHAWTQPALGFDSAGADFGLSTPMLPNAPPASYPMWTGWWSTTVPTFTYEDPFGLLKCKGSSTASCGTTETKPGARYFASIAHNHFGGATAGDLDVAGVYKCPAPTSSLSMNDLTGCSRIPFSAEAAVTIGWIKARKTWTSTAVGATAETGHAAEHMQLFLRAAGYAGLANLPFMTSRFWVRYPVDDAYVASPIPRAPGDTSDSVAVGQSWRPRDFSDVRAHAVRSVYIPELAQLPDVSNTAWDWASGNEDCPISGIDVGGTSPFGNTALDTNACHTLSAVMGTINQSHFLPAAESFYNYYHGLALTRMRACGDIADRLQAYYAQNPVSYGSYGTEAQECEREAMVFEAIAQHYLQDAWSTGHMWNRWGGTALSLYPIELGASPYPGGVEDHIGDVRNSAARRFVTAAVVGAYAGSIHGAKGIVSDLTKPWVPPTFDDPLCGPFYYSGGLSPQRYSVQWTTGVQSETFPGVGDLFWNSSPAVQLATDPNYAEQRQRLLACSASSMLQVYSAGRKKHGDPDPTTAVPGASGVPGQTAILPESVDPSSAYCWSHRATNDSMVGAIGPVAIDYQDQSMFFKASSGLPT